MSKKETVTYSGLGLALVAILLIALNVIGSAVYVRQDLTEDQLYTLSAGSKALLGKLKAPVTLRFYYSRDVADLPPFVKQYAARVADLLKEYELAGNGRIKIERLNPRPDTDAEDSARLDGIEPRESPSGEPIYLGLAITRADLKESLPFLNPQTENTLEYDISRAIYRICAPEKKKLGLLTMLPLKGTPRMPPGMAMQMPQREEPWDCYTQLTRDYDVVDLPPELDSVPADVPTVVVIHPKNLSDKALYALDQFVLRGGKLIAFVDPLSAVDKQSNPMGGFQPPTPSTLGKLFDAWGVKFAGDKMVADRICGLPVGPNKRDFAIMALDQERINQADTITGKLNVMVLLYPGAFDVAPPKGVTSTVLIHTSRDAQLVDSFKSFSAEAVANDFKSDDKEYALAVRLAGKFPSAFPGGPPEPPKPPEADKDKPEAEKPPAGAHLAAATAEATVVLVGDVDMLHDSVWQEAMQDFFSRRTVKRVRYDNNNLLQSAAELLTGDSSLISIRAKVVTARPFEVVREMEAKAQDKMAARLKSLMDEREEAEKKLRELQRAKKDDSQRYVMSPAQLEEKQKFERKMAETNRAIKDLRKEFRREIDSLSTKLRIVNIGLVPVLVILAGIVVALIRKRG